MLCGSAKNARYSSEGASTASSGPGTAWSLRAACTGGDTARLDSRPMITISDLDGLRAKTGEELGVSDWHDVTQEAIDAFAASPATTSGSTSIPQRARQTPFGGTIAHGYYTLSLHPTFSPRRSSPSRASRSPSTTASTASASRPRCRSATASACGSSLVDVDDVLGGAQITMKLTFEGEGALKPVCVAESLIRVYTE